MDQKAEIAPPGYELIESANKVRSELLYGQDYQKWLAVCLILADMVYKLFILPPPVLDTHVKDGVLPSHGTPGSVEYDVNVMKANFVLVYAFVAVAVFLSARVVRDQLIENLFKKHKLPVYRSNSAWAWAPVIIVIILGYYLTTIWSIVSVKKLIGPVLSIVALSTLLAQITRNRSDEETLQEVSGVKKIE